MFIANHLLIKVKQNIYQKLIEILKTPKKDQKLKRRLLKIKNSFQKQQKLIFAKKIILIIIIILI